MTKTMCPAGCGKKYISKEHADAHADRDHPDWKIPKSRGWATPNGFIDFPEPVTYEHACKVAQEIHDRYVKKYPDRVETIKVDVVVE